MYCLPLNLIPNKTHATLGGGDCVNCVVLFTRTTVCFNAVVVVTVGCCLSHPFSPSPPPPLLLLDTSRALFADSRPEHARLKRALELTREILSYIDAQVDARAKEQRLIEIYNKLDARSYAIYKGAKFKVRQREQWKAGGG